jgi:hypothetical protein
MIQTLRNHGAIWFYLSFVAPFYYGLITLHHSFSYDYIVQDDARQHVVWFQQFIDPQLFPNDWIASYFQTVAPAGYQFIYWIAANLGIQPLILAKLLPLPLALITTFYGFRITRLILPLPLSGFIATLVLNQHLWLNDDLVSATARAFVYPLFAAFWYYLLQQSILPCLISLALQGLFFPQMMLLQVAILIVRLVDWQNRWPRLSKCQQDYQLGIGGLAIALLVAMPFILNLSTFGSAITADQMRVMPEYNLGGRSEYFGVTPFSFVFNGSSGIRIPIFPSIIWVGFGLPFLLKSRWSPIELVTKHVHSLTQIVVASLSLYILAHLLLLKLHFPSRYTYHSLRFVLAIATGIVLTTLLNVGYHQLQQKQRRPHPFSWRDRSMIGLTAIMLTVVVVVPAIPTLVFKFQGWEIGQASAIYTYLAQQPKDAMIASLSLEANNIPVFAQRSTLVGREFALAHHPNYYQELQQRAIALIQAHYSPNTADIHAIINAYDIDFLLVEQVMFEPEFLQQQDWLIYSSFRDPVERAIAQLQQGIQPALQQLIDQCAIASTSKLTLIKAQCLNSSQLD